LDKQASSGQTDIFGNQDDSLRERPRLELQAPAQVISSHEQLLWERELLGLYLSQHPLELFETILSEQTIPLNTLNAEHDGQTVSVGGAIADVREITTKNGQKMAFVRIEDRFGEIEAVLFPKSLEQTSAVWVRDHVVLIKGKISTRGKGGDRTADVKLMVDTAREITAEQAQDYQANGRKLQLTPKKTTPQKLSTVPDQPDAVQRVYVRLVSTSDEKMLLSLKETIDLHHGNTEVVLVLGDAAAKQAIKLPGGIDRAGEGLTKLEQLVGTDNLVVQ
jgi:DNA polymerase III alpha subunit